MSNNQKIDFSKFFLGEFLDKICEISKSRISGKEYKTVESLITNLKSESDFSDGIEILAREHSTSELSIFLFDILERIMDYPPTLVHDSLGEMAEDFVNTLEIMFEEEETLKTIRKINKKFESKKEIVTEDELVEEKPVELVEDKTVPAEKKTTEESFGIDDFIKTEFLKNINDNLVSELGNDRADDLIKFTEILINDSGENDFVNAPDSVSNLNEKLEKSFAQAEVGTKSIIDNREELNELLPGIVDNLKQLASENVEILDSSINANRIVIPDIKTDIPAEQKIEKKPTSIESLLFAYFQSEMDEYLEVFQNGFENLQNDSANISALERLEKKFHSFKEISMIHGYEIIEMLCTKMIQILSDARTNRYVIKDSFFDVSKEILDELSQCEKLKGKTTGSEEASHIDYLLNKLEESIDKTEIVQESEPTVTAEEEVQEETGDVVTENLISFEDGTSVFSIFRDVANDIQKHLKNELLENKDNESANDLFEKISKTASIFGNDSLNDFGVEYTNRLDNLKLIEGDKYSTAANSVIDILQNTIPKLSVEFKDNDWKDVFSEFDLNVTPFYTFQDSSELLAILMDIEKHNLNDFKKNLQKIINNQDEDLKDKQKYHFHRLHKNLNLLGTPDLMKFSEFYMNLFNGQTENNFSDVIINEIDQSYKLFIERVLEKGNSTNPEDILNALEEVMNESAQTEEKKEPEKTEEPPEDEMEEDLDQIFKDEAKNFIWKIEDAFALLETDYSNNTLLNEIEKNAHSLKSSARLMGKDDIADICAKVEKIVEQHISKNMAPEVENLNILRKSIGGVKSFIDDEIQSLEDFDSDLSQVEEKLQQEILSEGVEEDKPVDESEEKPLFADDDDDDDMLEIFKEESSNFINIIENSIESLKTGEQSSEAIHQFEYASHSLKSAAKMLGFREIGQIADGLEQLAESLSKNEIIHDDQIDDVLTKSVVTIKALSEGEKLSSSDIADMLNQLEIQRIIERQSESEDLQALKTDGSERFEIDPMIDLFIKEAWELLEKINRDLVELEKKHDSELLKNLNRNVHTLKGSAQMMQFEKIGKISHAIEDFFENHQDDKEALPDGALDPIFKGFDEIQELMESVKTGKGEVSSNYDEVLANLGISVEEKPKIESEPERIEKEPAIPQDAPEPETIEHKVPSLSADESQQLIKISTTRLDNLINMAAELVINKTQLVNYIDSLKKIGIDLDKDRDLLKNADYTLDDIIIKRKKTEVESEDSIDMVDYSDDSFNDLSNVSSNFKQTLTTIDSVTSKFNSLTQGFEQNIGRIANLIKMLHDDILQVRMLPIENLFNRFPRAVRDLSHQQKKKVDLVIQGEQTEMDRAMIESLTDPIMHLLRNAIDHGIETPADRKTDGKDESGTIFLKAHQDKNQIIIEVQDDGRGINLEAIKNKLIEKNIVNEEQLNEISTAEVLDYIFSPGFSTRDEASEVSGRGIGLDVVADQVQKLKGDIRVNSTPGNGTTFSIRVPLTLIISQVMLFKQADQILAVPLISVEESIQLNIDTITIKDNKKYINVREESIPVLDLNELLKFAEPKETGEVQAILIQETGIRYALIVDEVIRREEIVIKSLGDHLQNLEYVSGGTILGDGSIALIIDTTAIVRKVEKDYKEFSQDLSTTPKIKKQTVPLKEQQDIDKSIDKHKISDRKPVALIVDDSISVRRFVASVLEKNNYTTILASNGVDAIDCLAKTTFDIMVTDLEMPKMHGFELIEKVRAQKKYKKLPIVILTGRAGKKHKKMGVELGANAFIVKPFKEIDLLKTLKKFIVH